MTRSIRRRTLLTILPLVSIIWLSFAYLSFYNTKAEINSFLDAQLAQNGQVLLAMSMHELVEQRLLSESNTSSTEVADSTLWKNNHYGNQISFQVSLHNKTLTLRSENAPESHMSGFENGFSTVSLFNNRWRVYSTSTEDNIITVQVAMKISAQNIMAKTITERVIAPLILLLPLLAFFFMDGNK